MFAQNPKLIEIMMDGSKIGQNRDIDVGVVGNSKAVLRQIMDELNARGYRSPGKGWVEEVMTEDKTLQAADEEMLNSDQTPIHPMRLVREVRDFLDYDATVIGDDGDIVTFAARVLNINEAGHWLDPGQFGCLGAGSGFAAAAQLARPGKQVCIIYGDGGFGHRFSVAKSAKRSGGVGSSGIVRIVKRSDQMGSGPGISEFAQGQRRRPAYTLILAGEGLEQEGGDIRLLDAQQPGGVLTHRRVALDQRRYELFYRMFSHGSPPGNTHCMDSCEARVI